MQIGLLGKANVGKSTFFSAATETPVQIGNFPFTTIIFRLQQFSLMLESRMLTLLVLANISK